MKSFLLADESLNNQYKLIKTDDIFQSTDDRYTFPECIVKNMKTITPYKCEFKLFLIVFL